MKNPLLIFLIISSFTANSQISVTLKDSLTNEPIAYANVWVIGENIGTTADEQGNFTLNNSAGNKRIAISCVGFDRKETLFDTDSKTIYLKRADNLLKEVSVTPRLRDKTLVVGRLSKKDRRFRFGNTGTPWIIGRYFPSEDTYENTPYIQQIRCVTSSKIVDSKFGVRIYRVDKGGKPVAALHNDLIIGTAKKGDEFTKIDIADLGIKMPDTGVLIGLEWIITTENQYEQTYSTKNEPKVEKKQIRYSPNFGTSKVVAGQQPWIYRKGSWKSDKEIHGNNSPMDGRSVSIELTLSN